MKTRIITCLLIVACFQVKAQWPANVVSNAADITIIENQILRIEYYENFRSQSPTSYGLKLSKFKLTDINNDGSIKQLINQHLIPILDIDNQNTFDEEKFVYYIDRIKHTETITWLQFELLNKLKETEAHPELNLNTCPSFYRKIILLVEKRMDIIMNHEFSNYRFTETSNKALKGIYLDHTNDYLSIMSKYNDDRDLTGAFRFEFLTDKIKMRLFTSYSDNFLNPNSRNWYSFQSLFIGGEGYTPFLRDITLFNSPNSVDSADRPYASFQYVGRAKYRISRLGNMRMFSQIKIGSIGKSTPDNIQSVIHRDIITSSVKPNGWGAQIASGGRIAFNYDFIFEPLWISQNKFIAAKFRNFLTKKDEAKLDKYKTIFSRINVSTPIELKVGHDMTSYGLGLTISTLDFKKSGGMNILSNFKESESLFDFFKNNINLSYTIKGRHVVHNSMLEGYGVFSHNIDENATSPIDAYVLAGNQIKRDLIVHEVTASIKGKYCSLILKNTFMSPEFNLDVNNKAYSYGGNSNHLNDNINGNHNRSPWNHYGTIGLLFKIQ